jgi:serine/threonine-protein kinase
MSSSSLELGREVAGRYRIVRFIGKGGMGSVYEVEHLHTGQHLAMKVLTSHQRDVSVERFKREARAASLIQSDHVVRVTDADVAEELGGAPFLVMELLEGADLERVAAGGPASREDVVEWLRQVARGLVKAHDADMVHRDLKPENLFLTRREDGSPLVKILDFGIAKMAASEARPLTQSGQFLGTPDYMAPEQTDAHAVVSRRADLFALGLIAFRLLVGRTYWNPGSLHQVVVQLLTGPKVPPSARGSTLGEAFDAWFLRSCDLDPQKRFDSAFVQVEALAEALGIPPLTRTSWDSASARSASESALTALEGAPTLDASSHELETPISRGKRRRLWYALGAGAVGVVGLLAMLGQARRSPAPEASSRPSVSSSDPPPLAPAVSSRIEPIGAAASVAPPLDAASPAAPSAVSSTVPRRAPRPSTTSRPTSTKDPLEGPY